MTTTTSTVNINTPATSAAHVDASLNKIRTIFERVALKIDALKPGEKVTATGLAAEVAVDFGMTGPQLYHTLKFLFNDYPGVKILRGAHGGILKLDPNAPVGSAKEEGKKDD